MNCWSKSIAETQEFARDIARSLCKDAAIFFMVGEMGAGKTTLARFMAQEINGRQICSSSYGLVNVYHGSRVIVHCDFYRKAWNGDFYESEVLEHLNARSVLILEWAPPQLLESGVDTYRIEISSLSSKERRFTVSQIF